MLTSFDAQKTIVNGLKQYVSGEIERYSQTERVEPLYNDIPLVYLTGVLPTTKTELYGQLDYISNTYSFHAFIKIKCQGNSSMDYPKKNYSIKLYADAGCSIPLNESFRNWGNHNNYVLKANYIDHLHARNIVCANLWADIVRSRDDFESLPEELKNSPNMGAIDGFPVKVYANGKYEGLYTWNIPKCDWQFGLDESNMKHALLSAEFNDNGLEENRYNPCNFNAAWDGDEKYWSIEVGKDKESIINSLNAVISFCRNLADFACVLDMKSVIDYYILQEVIGGVDGLAKNMLMVTYDMNMWYLSAYDMDSTFDLSWDGSVIGNPDISMPSDYENHYSRLLEYAVSEVYYNEYIERYAQLREGALSTSNIMDKFNRFLSIADEDIRIEDTIAYPDIPSVTENNVHALRDYIIKRLNSLDARYL